MPEDIPYDVGFSFAGEQWEMVRSVRKELPAHLRVFLDSERDSELWGSSLIETLPLRYWQCLLSVLVVSDEYLAKKWPSYERRAILRRVLQTGELDRIMVVQVAPYSARILGLSEEGYIRWADTRDASKAARAIERRLDRLHAVFREQQ